MHLLYTAPTEELDKQLNINVKGTFFSYKYAALQLIKQGTGGRIVGAASIASKKGRGVLLLCVALRVLIS